jgi:hypothetical protein
MSWLIHEEIHLCSPSSQSIQEQRERVEVPRWLRSALLGILDGNYQEGLAIEGLATSVL